MIETQPWWQSSIIYQIYPRSFQDTNEDGIGDLLGVIQRLDYLHDLGVGGIWLTPVYPSPLFDFGYDVADYEDIDPAYGSLEDFDTLVEEAGKRNIKIVMDLVANHTSHLHQWFHESRSSRDNPKRDWYIWRDSRAGEEFPNNWASVFGGRAWTLDELTGQYYCHAFLKEQPDLNWRNPDVRRAIGNAMRFWMKRGVAGFRLDAIAHIGKSEGLPNNPAKPEAASQEFHEWSDQIHEHDLAEPIMHDWLRELRSVADEYGSMLVGEIYSLDPQSLASFTGERELHSVFNFDLLSSPWDAQAFRRAVDQMEAAFPSGVWPSPVLDNHDNSRSFSRWDQPGFGFARASVAMTMLLTLRGTPYLYYGQEIGMHDVEIPRSQLHDPVGVKGWPEQKGRDPERTPMQWNGDHGSGFTTVDPWLPLADDADQVNVEAELSETSSLLNHTRRLAALRNQLPALHRGTYRSIDGLPVAIFGFIREDEDQKVLVLLNTENSPVSADASREGRFAHRLMTGGGASEEVDLANMTLDGLSAEVLLVTP